MIDEPAYKEYAKQSNYGARNMKKTLLAVLLLSACATTATAPSDKADALMKEGNCGEASKAYDNAAVSTTDIKLMAGYYHLAASAAKCANWTKEERRYNSLANVYDKMAK
jgi:hypothetical protein